MALLQEEGKDTSAEAYSLLKLEDSNETRSSSISHESKAGVEDDTCVKGASNTDETVTQNCYTASNTDETVSIKSASTTDGTGRQSTSNPVGTGTERTSNADLDDEFSDENIERKITTIDPQLKEKQYIFLKKYFDELRTRKRLPNWYKRYGERITRKPPKFEDVPCECIFENKRWFSDKTKEFKELFDRPVTTIAQMDIKQKSLDNLYKELLAWRENAYAQSDISKKSLAGHNNTCNANRLNRYFRAITEYFTEEDSHPYLFFLELDPPVDYKQKAMREIRKRTVLKLRYGLEKNLEEWEDCMTDEDVEKWKKRNNIREFLHFILNNMLESLIGPNESPTESEDDEADESAQSPSTRNAQIDPDKLQYQTLKKLHEELEQKFKDYHERKKRFIQDAVIDGYYSEIQKNMRKKRAEENELRALSPEVSSEESERETEQEKNEIRGSEKK